MKKKNSELDLLSSLEDGKEITQKTISNKISVSIGFVNALIKKFLKKGIIKVQQAPYKRFIYYITPDGFSQKSKLVLEYLTDSLSLFRALRNELSLVFSIHKDVGFFLYGISEITEIAILSANEKNVRIEGIVEINSPKKTYLNISIFKELPKDLKNEKIIICCKKKAQEIYFDLIERYNEDNIIAIDSLFISKKRPNFQPEIDYDRK